MKKIQILLLTLLAIGPIYGNGFFVATEPVNNVIGDISYITTFNQLPTSQTDENLRIRTHLEYVEQQLSNQNTDHLTPTQKNNRTVLLDLLHDYWQAEQFPKNHHFPQRKSVFFDNQWVLWSKLDNFLNCKSLELLQV